MEMVQERVKKGGMIQIPPPILETLGLVEGDGVYLRVMPLRLVIVPSTPRKRLWLDAEIVDELVEHEELFEPEVS